MTEIATPQSLLAFWSDAGPKKWFTKDQTFDDAIRDRFATSYEAAAAGQLTDWESSADGALALTILLDQCPRNLFRGDARAFATDALAREIVGRAIARGFDRAVAPELRAFFYLPYEHSEDLTDQMRGIALYRAVGDADGLKWAEIHADIIRRFGRFPHRNAALGRETTAEERAFLEAGGFSG